MPLRSAGSSSLCRGHCDGVVVVGVRTAPCSWIRYAVGSHSQRRRRLLRLILVCGSTWWARTGTESDQDAEHRHPSSSAHVKALVQRAWPCLGIGTCVFVMQRAHRAGPSSNLSQALFHALEAPIIPCLFRGDKHKGPSHNSRGLTGRSPSICVYCACLGGLHVLFALFSAGPGISRHVYGEFLDNQDGLLWPQYWPKPTAVGRRPRHRSALPPCWFSSPRTELEAIL